MSSAPGWPTQSDPNRRAVEQALVACVCEEGLANVTVETVCRHGGFGPQQFRDVFPDVDEGYRRLFELGTQEVLSDALVAYTGAGDGFAGRIRAVAHAMYRFMALDERRARFLYVEVFAASEATQLVRDQGMEGMYELIDQGRHELEDPGSISRATAEAIGGAVLTRIRMGVAVEDGLESFRLSVPRLMYNVVRPYVGEEAARAELELPPPERPA